MPLTTVLLDAGGVIIDETEYEKIHARILVDLLAESGLKYSVHLYNKDVDEAVKSFCPNVYQFIIWKNCGEESSLYCKIHNEYQARWVIERTPYKLMDGIAREIKILCSKFQILLAGQYGNDILELLKKCDIGKYFANNLTQDDYDITKPDPRFLERITASAGSTPECCVMVGDRIDKDIIPAKMLGMKTILIRGGLHRNQAPRIPSEFPDIELESIVGLSGAIEKLAME